MWRAAVAALLLVSGCASSASQSVGGAHSQRILLTAQQNHTVVHVQLGDRLHVRLDSTYWRFRTPGGVGLREAGKPSYVPSGDCVPGGGCGTAIADYTAVRAGTAHVLASRISCGEAMMCPLASRTYTVTVIVAG